MGIIDKIRDSENIEIYIERITGQKFKNVGSWKTIHECPFCSGHDCARFSKEKKFYCFQCQNFASDIIQFRALYENILWKESVERFINDLGLKKSSQKNIEWFGIREMACDICRDILYSCQTKYTFRGQKITPLFYLTDIRYYSYEAISFFRLGFNDGTLHEKLRLKYSEDIIKSSGLNNIQEGVFIYPVIANNQIQYFRLKDPNKNKKAQMTIETRGKDAYWYNQDCLKNGIDLCCVEGEDDVISLWQAGENVIGSLGNITKDQVNYLKTFDIVTIYAGFDSDAAGERDVSRLVKNYDSTNIYVFKYPENCKDPDEVLRGKENKKDIVYHLKHTAISPSPELRSVIKQKLDGYFIDINWKNSVSEKRLTNWIGIVEAIIIKEEGLRERKIRIKRGQYEVVVYMEGSVLCSVSRLREFLLNNCNETCLFIGTDSDLNALVQYWGVAYNPEIVKQTDCVGEIEEGFIADNVFIGLDNEIKPLVDGYLKIDKKHSIKIAELTTQVGERSQIPIYPLTEPYGGIEKFKKKVFDLLILNRNLKVAISIGWLKACLWSKNFFKDHRFFPILMVHGKTRSGKSIFSYWLMSILGMRDVQSTSLDEKRSRSVGIERKLSYYSSLPVWADDYKSIEGEGLVYHGLFRNIFDRTSAPKGIRNNPIKIRNVIIKSCLLLNGETAINDDGLNSRLITFEFLEAERNDKYWYDIVKLEPEFAHIGFDWIKKRNIDYPIFQKKYNEIEKVFRKKIKNPRQAQVWAVAIAGCMTESYFIEQEEKITNYAIKLANQEIEAQKSEELIGMFWEAVNVLSKVQKLDEQIFYCDFIEKQIQIHLPGLLAEISGNQKTRQYKFPKNREVAKILKQESYYIDSRTVRVNGKADWRWVLDVEKCPEVLRNIFDHMNPNSNFSTNNSESDKDFFSEEV